MIGLVLSLMITMITVSIRLMVFALRLMVVLTVACVGAASAAGGRTRRA